MSLHAGSTPVIFADLSPVQPLDTLIPRLVQGASKPIATCTEEARCGWSPALDILDELTEQSARYSDYVYVAARKEQLAAPKDIFTARYNHAIQEATRSGQPVTRRYRAELKEQLLHELRDQRSPKITATPLAIDATGAVVIGGGNLRRFDAVSGLLQMSAPKPASIASQIAAGVKTVDLGSQYLSQLTPETFAWQRLNLDPLDMPSLDLGTPDCERIHLGPEFLTWVWYMVEQKQLPWVVIDGPLRFVGDAVAGQTDVCKGLPTHSPEATAALRSGKYLSSAQLMLSLGGESVEVVGFRFDADNFILKSVHLPAGHELDAEAHFGERMGYLRQVRALLEELLTQFIHALAANELQQPMQAWLDDREAQHRDA